MLEYLKEGCFLVVLIRNLCRTLWPNETTQKIILQPLSSESTSPTSSTSPEKYYHMRKGFFVEMLSLLVIWTE